MEMKFKYGNIEQISITHGLMTIIWVLSAFLNSSMILRKAK